MYFIVYHINIKTPLEKIREAFFFAITLPLQQAQGAKASKGRGIKKEEPKSTFIK